MTNLIHEIMTTIELGLAIALAISEALALIPKVNANSIFQLIYNILKNRKNG